MAGARSNQVSYLFHSAASRRTRPCERWLRKAFFGRGSIVAYLLVFVMFGFIVTNEERKTLKNLWDNINTAKTISVNSDEPRNKNKAPTHPTRILLGQDPWPNTSHISFVPGSLDLTRIETLRHCRVDPERYKHHFSHWFAIDKIQFCVSDKYKLIYYLLPKAGSSTSRAILNKHFNATEYAFAKTKLYLKKYEHISFVREPLDRFFSSFEEMFWRIGPWATLHKETERDLFPFLHEGIPSLKAYEQIYCPSQKCKNSTLEESHENGTLAQRLERFVEVYDDRTTFLDVHMSLQTAMLMTAATEKSGDGSPVLLPLEQLYDTTNITNEWKRIASLKGISSPSNELDIREWSHPRRVNVSLVSTATRRRICQYASLDYCCLNFELPPECQKTVTCVLEKLNDRLQIRPESKTARD